MVINLKLKVYKFFRLPGKEDIRRKRRITCSGKLCLFNAKTMCSVCVFKHMLLIQWGEARSVSFGRN